MEPAIQQQPLPPSQNPAPPAPPPVPANVQQAQAVQTPSFLQRLREQVARELAPDPNEEAARRFRTFGAAMMGSQGDFFQGLAAGQQAVDRQRQQEEQARAGRLQQMEQEAQRQAELNLRQAEFEYNRDPTNPTNQLRLAQARQALAELAQGRRPNIVQLLDSQDNVVLVNAETGREIRNTGLRSPQTARLNATAENTLRQNARNQAMLDVRSMETAITNAGGRVTAEQRAQFLRDAEERALASVGLLPLSGSSTTQQQPAPGGRPVVREGYVPPEQRR